MTKLCSFIKHVAALVALAGFIVFCLAILSLFFNGPVVYFFVWGSSLYIIGAIAFMIASPKKDRVRIGNLHLNILLLLVDILNISPWFTVSPFHWMNPENRQGIELIPEVHNLEPPVDGVKEKEHLKDIIGSVDANSSDGKEEKQSEPISNSAGEISGGSAPDNPNYKPSKELEAIYGPAAQDCKYRRGQGIVYKVEEKYIGAGIIIWCQALQGDRSLRYVVASSIYPYSIDYVYPNDVIENGDKV